MNVRVHALSTPKSGMRFDANGEDYVVGALRHLGRGGPDDNEAQAGHLIAHTLLAEGADASEDGTGRGVPMVTLNAYAGGNQVEGAYHSQGATVRRLTPTETERLQGFAEGWTCLCGVTPYSTMTCRCPDSARYRAMGNAVTVQVITWIGRRLIEARR